MSLTAAQQEAIAARGNVLVVAGAGTGKTRTLVERCLGCLLEGKPPASLDEILVVTFTEAAATEMRQRLRARLEQEAKLHSGEARWQEQLALFETAHIGTLHSFCLQLIRQHFYELELDPQLTVLASEEQRLLASETLDSVLDGHYAGEGASGEPVRQLIQMQGRGSDEPIRALVLRLHHYTQTLPDPAAWFRRQLALFAAPEPSVWQDWLRTALAEWRERWMPVLERAVGNGVAANCGPALKSLLAKPAETAAVLETIVAAGENYPRGKKLEWVKPLSEFLGEAKFLLSLVSGAPNGAGQSASAKHQAPSATALSQDWEWVRGPMSALLKLAEEFSQAFAEAKRELGVVDFHDLEQHALRLLWDAQADKPSKVAQQWRNRLRFVFVDEYQDINAAQDKLIEALSRDGSRANRFLVGDVKQSIYRFRLANPAIFQGYVRTWGEGAGQVIPLTDNFRSREGILNFVNSLFAVIMRPELGGVAYDERAKLRFGAAAERAALAAGSGAAPAVELHLRVKAGTNHTGWEEDSDGAMGQLAEMQEAEKEARLVALRLRELKARQHPIWDEGARQFRPVEWSDMAVLLRSPANKAESYAKEFARLNVPLLVERRGFYETLEVTDLLSLLQMLDNPLQDLPVLAVLHSPLVGLSINELAAIRLTASRAPFWTALVRWNESPSAGRSGGGRLTGDAVAPGEGPVSQGGPEQALESSESETSRKVSAFLERFGRWRRLARQVSLSRCLEAVLTETHYADWLLTQPRGEQRQANVQRLLGLAQQFDLFQRQGLFRFLRFVQAQQVAETEPEVAAVSEADSVRLMSIHQSKGLEFPVVVLADLGKAFNVSDLRAEVILDEEYGLCPQIKPPHTGKRYPSLPYWLASRRQLRELLGEELRLLYVAMTRARDLLLLSGSVSGAQLERWSTVAEGGSAGVSSARSYSEWLGQWFAQTCQVQLSSPVQGQNELLRWVLHDDLELAAPAAEAAAADAVTALQAAPAVWRGLQQRLSWHYPFPAATRQPAKTSVSVLRRRAGEAEEDGAAQVEVRGKDYEGRRAATSDQREAGTSSTPQASRLTQHGPHANAAEVGIAHHLFLQLVGLERTQSAAELSREAERLQREGALTAGQSELLDFEAMAAFWNSELGRKARAQAQFVHRELAFTARFPALEVAALTGGPPGPGLDGEFVVVQGVADLAVVSPEEIWLVDFKTDRIRPDELAGKVNEYQPQLRLYAEALSQIYQRPVSGCWLYLLGLRKAVPVSFGTGATT